MATAIITIKDIEDGNVNINIEFNPPFNEDDKSSPEPHLVALNMLALLQQENEED